MFVWYVLKTDFWCMCPIEIKQLGLAKQLSISSATPIKPIKGLNGWTVEFDQE